MAKKRSPLQEHLMEHQNLLREDLHELDVLIDEYHKAQRKPTWATSGVLDALHHKLEEAKEFLAGELYQTGKF